MTSAQRRHILILEPDADTNEAVCELLSDCGAPLHCVSSVDEALSWLSDGGAPCALVVSCGPHDVDDLRRLVGVLRRRMETVDTPLFVTTTVRALKPLDDRTTVVPKPFNSSALYTMVQAAAARCS